MRMSVHQCFQVDKLSADVLARVLPEGVKL